MSVEGIFRVDKFKAVHLGQLREQEAMSMLIPHLTDAHLKSLEESPHSYSGMVGNRVVVCAGVTEYWPGRGEAWAVFNSDAKKEFVHLHNSIKRFLKICPVRRIEASVKIGFEAGHRWVRALGFKLETPLAKEFLPDGSDCAIYVRIS